MAGFFTLQVSIPPGSGGTGIGNHLFLEIPDQSSTATFTVGTNTVGDGSTTAGAWNYIDLGKYPLNHGTPWTITGPAPFDFDDTRDTPCRLYAVPYSPSYEAQLVQANQTGASTNVLFTLISLKSGSPTAGTNVTTLTGDDGNYISIVASAFAPVNITGKLETPVLVDVSGTPPNTPGWVARLVLTVATADPTQAANQQIVGSIFTKAGPVYAAPGDGISVPHSFVLATPKAFTTATIWLQAGLKNASGTYRWNNIVPGITPSFQISYGSTTGTTDATAIMTATIDASMAIVSGAFGVAVSGIDSTRLASLAVTAAKLASSSVTATAIANLAVGNAAIANLAVDASKIVSATITGAQIASATIAGANIGTATIVQSNMASASIGTAQIQSLAVTDALIASLSASKITAGTISAVTITTATINGGSISGTSLRLALGSGTTTTIGTSAIIGSYYGVGVSSSGGTAAVYSVSSQAGFAVYNGSSQLLAAVYTGSSTAGALEILESSGTVIFSANVTGIFSGILPSSYPGSGTKAFWYDPSDSYRVKFAA